MRWPMPFNATTGVRLAAHYATLDGAVGAVVPISVRPHSKVDGFVPRFWLVNFRKVRHARRGRRPNLSAFVRYRSEGEQTIFLAEKWLKPGPEPGLDCLACAEFARQRRAPRRALRHSRRRRRRRRPHLGASKLTYLYHGSGLST